uniref:Uncharacterized protein n=1 Tax=Anguilla anguilla TaxID=7936 RepID=A0A0E9PPH3_ANGAN
MLAVFLEAELTLYVSLHLFLDLRIEETFMQCWP